MEKATKTINYLLNIILLVCILAVAIYAFTSIDSLKNALNDIFKLDATNIYAFNGADVNYNGGLTRTQIEAQKANDSCPKHIDVNDTIYIQDYGGCVCFYKKTKDENGKTIYPNILFIKTSDGLKFDGALNMHGEAYAGWLGGIGAYFNVSQQYYNVPSYSDSSVFIFDNPSDNFVNQTGFSGFITRAVECWSQRQQRLETSQQYVIKNIYPYFLKFYDNNVEIIQDENTASGDFNFFYDYVYRSAKAYDYGTDTKGNAMTRGICSVDVTKMTVYPLPDELKGKYAIPSTSPIEYFGIYSCNVYLTCNYSLESTQKSFDDNSYITDGLKDDPIEIMDFPVTPLCNMQISLVPKGEYLNTTIKSIVDASPVTISFVLGNNPYKKLVFSREYFENSKATIITGFDKGDYTYTISSNQLLFDSFSGNTTISASGTFDIKYSYQNGKVLASFAICPESSDIDYSSTDLVNYPVRLILNGVSTQTTNQFVFDNMSTLLDTQQSLMPLGKYSYTILSQKLIFGSTSGSIEITPENRKFAFSFGVIYNRSDLDFSVVVSSQSSSTSGVISLYGNSTTVVLLGSKLNLQNYYVNIAIFDDDGHILQTLNHTHNGNVTCGDTWTTTTLTAGTKYTAQMTYANGTDSTKTGYIEYQSSTFTFNYDLLTKYTFTYSCKEVK